MADIPGFAEAIRDAQRRRVVLPETFYGDTIGRVRAASATVSGLAGLDQVQAVVDSLRAALDQGQSFEAWKKALLESGQDFGLSGAHLETIFRTNVQGWYAAGRAEQIQRLKGDFPYLRYSAILDARTRPEHAELDGLILPVDHPLWKSHYPPWSFNCRCSVIPMTAAAAEDAIGKAREAGKVIDQAPPDLAPPSPGWNYDRLNPAAPLEGLERAVARRFGQCVPRQFASRKAGTPLLWCEGPGAEALDMARTALAFDMPMPSPQRLAQALEVPHGLRPEAYVAEFMREFGAGAKETVLWTSVRGQTLAIHGGIFERHGGGTKIDKRGRHQYVRYVAHGLKVPDEVWYVHESSGVEKLYYLARMQVGGGALIETLAVFVWSGKAWEPTTGYQGVDAKYVAGRREWLQTAGTLLYMRDK